MFRFTVRSNFKINGFTSVYFRISGAIDHRIGEESHEKLHWGGQIGAIH